MSDQTSPWLRVEQAAAYAGQHPKVLYRACQRRELQHARITGRKTIVTRQEWLDAWIEGKKVRVVEPAA